MPCFIAVCKVTAYCEICKTILTISYFHGKGYWYLQKWDVISDWKRWHFLLS